MKPAQPVTNAFIVIILPSHLNSALLSISPYFSTNQSCTFFKPSPNSIGAAFYLSFYFFSTGFFYKESVF